MMQRRRPRGLTLSAMLLTPVLTTRGAFAQAPKAGEGQWLPFFGRPAYTMTLAARLSEAATQVVFVWGERLPRGAGFRLRFTLPAQPPSGDLNERAAALNREVETLIRLCPEQYLWGYNRYKRPAGVPPPPDGESAA